VSADKQPAAAHARETAIWLELRAMFAQQQVRLDNENELRAQENVREQQLRDELETLHAGEPLDPFAGVEIES
jgi:hypothetical protein